MADLALKYVTELFNEYRYWPIWLPGRRLRVGDCGRLEDGVFFDFKRHASAYGVSKEALKTKPATRDPVLHFVSSDGVDVETQAKGQNAGITSLPAGTAGARIKFTRAHSTFLAAVEVSELTLVDKQALEDELVELVKKGDFPAEYVVITDVVRAGAARVIISTNAGQEVTLQAEASLAAASFSLASLGAKLSVQLNSSAGAEYGGGKGMTPLFKPMGFEMGGRIRRFLRRFSRGRRLTRIVVKSLRSAPTVGNAVTVEPIAADALAVAPLDRDPFVIQPMASKPFTVEPLLVDTRALEAIAPVVGNSLAGAGALGSDVRSVVGSILVGSIEGEPTAAETLVVHPLDPIVIQPVDEDPFLVRLPENEALIFDSVEFEDFRPPFGVGTEAAAASDPLHFDYLDFEAELAAAELDD